MELKTIKVVVGKEYLAEVTVGNHTQILDEPIAAGGKDRGPDPYANIVSALGACTAITVRMYADRKGWKLEKVEVNLVHSRTHTIDCEHCDEPGFKLDKISKEVIFYGELTDEQKHRLKIISTKCPVQKTLEAGINIQTS